MTHLRTKEELLQWLSGNAPTGSVRRAIEDGGVELLGAFKPAPGSRSPGWVLRVTTPFGKMVNVVVSFNETLKRLKAYTVDHMSFKNYVGGNSPLYAGDNPKQYKEYRNVI